MLKYVAALKAEQFDENILSQFCLLILQFQACSDGLH